MYVFKKEMVGASLWHPSVVWQFELWRVTKTNFNCVFCFCSLWPSNPLYWVWRLAFESCRATMCRQISTLRGRSVNAEGRRFLTRLPARFLRVDAASWDKNRSLLWGGRFNVPRLSSYSQAYTSANVFCRLKKTTKTTKTIFLDWQWDFMLFLSHRDTETEEDSYYSVHLVRLFNTKG